MCGPWGGSGVFQVGLFCLVGKGRYTYMLQGPVGPGKDMGLRGMT